VKRLILDHYRRWWWVLALGAALEFGLGFIIAANPQMPFEFWAFLVALWTGATLLSLDLKNGALRALAPLPLTSRQIGRGWWLATVPIPAMALAALLFSGAAVLCHLNPSRTFPAERLALASLFNLVWLGISFTLIFNATRSFSGNWWGLVGNSFINILTIATFFGSMAFATNASKSPLKSAILLGLGALVTAIGWLRAEQFELGRAGIYLGRPGQIDLGRPDRSGVRLTPLKTNVRPGRHVAPRGCGGMTFLLRSTFVSAFLSLAAAIAIMALVWQWQDHALLRSRNMVTELVPLGSVMCGWLIIFSRVMPLVRQLRFLRTLPVSATRLACVMLATALLPLIAMGALVTVVAGLFLGTAEAVTILKSFTLVLAPVALCMSFAIWRGDEKGLYVLQILALIGFVFVFMHLQTLFHHPEHPFHLIGPVLGICLLLAFLHTRLVIRCGSRAYRVQANAGANHPWGSGR
jgi:hypothetical protein